MYVADTPAPATGVSEVVDASEDIEQSDNGGVDNDDDDDFALEDDQAELRFSQSSPPAKDAVGVTPTTK